MFVMTFCCALGALLLDNVLMSAFGLCIVTYIIELVMRARLKLVMSMFHLGESRYCFLSSLVSYCFIFCSCRNQSEGLAC